MCEIGDMKKLGHFFAHMLFWTISGARFCFKKGLKMPKKGQTWCFQPPFTLTKCTMKPDDKYERNPRYEKCDHFFALLRADLAVCGPVCGPFFSMLARRWCKYHCLTLKMQKAHRCRSSDTVFSFGEPYLTEKSAFWAILAVLGLILAVSGPVFSIFSPDLNKKKCCLAVQLQKAHRCRSFDPVFSLKDPYLTEKVHFWVENCFFGHFLTQKKAMYTNDLPKKQPLNVNFMR